MVEVKDKVVTVESLSTLHNHDKSTYMPMVDPSGSGTMTFNGIINVNSIKMGSGIELIPTENSLEIVFTNVEATTNEENSEEVIEEENTEGQGE